MGHMFNHCPFVNDKLRQILREEVINTHQPILPTTIIIVPNMFIIGIQAMNLSIAHTTIFANYQTT
jgi:hypothetical protein